MRLEEGNKEDVSDTVLNILTELGFLNAPISEDFSFAFTFGTDGMTQLMILTPRL